MRRFLESLYRSKFGRVMSIFANGVAGVGIHKPFMIYGYHDKFSNTFRKYTRISSSVVIMNRKSITIEDHVWVWHYSILDATEGLVINEGCQIGAWVGIFTHGSENSIRLLGEEFVNIPNTERLGYTRGSVEIGKYTFVGARSIILPGVTVGKGCLIGAGTLVADDVPDYSIVVGSPGQVRGKTYKLDKKFFGQYDFSDTYYDNAALELLRDEL